MDQAERVHLSGNYEKRLHSNDFIESVGANLCARTDGFIHHSHEFYPYFPNTLFLHYPNTPGRPLQARPELYKELRSQTGAWEQ
jgi:hypothetical protein